MQAKINISIDDVTPHPQSSIKVLDRCFELIEVFPSIKFTLFIPMKYCRMGEKEMFPLEDYPDFCDELLNLPRENFELGWHGWHHGILNESNNDEFRDLSSGKALQVFSAMRFMAKKSHLLGVIKPIFRPPAFRMSPGSFEACEKAGIEILALSDKPHCTIGYQGKDKEWGKVVYYNANPPDPDRPLKLFPKTEIVYHACEWDRSYLSKEMTSDLDSFLSKHIEKFDFAFMENMV